MAIEQTWAVQAQNAQPNKPSSARLHERQKQQPKPQHIMAGWKKKAAAFASRKTAAETTYEKTNTQPISNFTRYIEGKKENYPGRNGRGEKKHLVPRRELAEYWTRPRIDEVCKSYKPALPTRFKAVQENFLCIFSLLVYIDKVQYYPDFLSNSIWDDQLPFKNSPGSLGAPAYEDLFRSLLEHQWLFCPLVLDYARLSDLNLPPERVLPFHDEEPIMSGTSSRSTRVFKIRVYDVCNKLDRVSVRLLPRFLPSGRDKQLVSAEL
jgi:hypothetical protein